MHLFEGYVTLETWADIKTLYNSVKRKTLKMDNSETTLDETDR